MDNKLIKSFIKEAKNKIKEMPNDELKIANVLNHLVELSEEDEVEQWDWAKWSDFVNDVFEYFKEEKLSYCEKIFEVGQVLGFGRSLQREDLIVKAVRHEIASFGHIGSERAYLDEGSRRGKIQVLKMDKPIK
jgi:hypothetical protein